MKRIFISYFSDILQSLNAVQVERAPLAILLIFKILFNSVTNTAAGSASAP